MRRGTATAHPTHEHTLTRGVAPRPRTVTQDAVWGMGLQDAVWGMGLQDAVWGMGLQDAVWGMGLVSIGKDHAILVSAWEMQPRNPASTILARKFAHDFSAPATCKRASVWRHFAAGKR
jgi:hypothetical protein